MVFRDLLNAGVVVTLNTDNPTVSDTNLAYQYHMLQEMGLTFDEARQIAINTIKSTFLSEHEKNELLKLL